MRSSLARLAATIVVCTIVVGCMSATTPTPSATDASASPSASPSAVATLRPTSPPEAGLAVTAIDAGWSHTCALTEAGGARCWGAGTGGQLGDGTMTDSATPVDVTGLATGVTAISAGGSHTCALTIGGGVKCWGDNGYGALGDNTKDPSSRPTDVVGLATGVASIAAGLIHTCALTTVGGVKCWGYNGFGGLGNGTRAESLVPVDVQGLTSGVRAIAAGYEHACALTSAGAVKCWGSRTGAELGNGSTAHSVTPVDVTGLSRGVIAIAAGPEFACAVTGEAGVVCWGARYGSTPVAVVDPERRVSAISAGGSHACALTGEAGVICWGANYLGQLGEGSKTQHDEPVDVAGLGSGITAITAGYDHSCALTLDGLVSCWGDNWYGQLGGRTPCTGMSSSAVPVVVEVAAPSATSEPSSSPIGRIEHARGPTDVVLRLDSGPDIAVGELEGELFQPGPEFTLYGDGTVIFRTGAERPPPKGAIIRALPFTIAHLTDDQVQVLLQFAVGKGGLIDACELYEHRDTDAFGSLVITIRTRELTKRVEVGGPSPLGAVIDRFFDFDPGPTILTQTWQPARYWGSLFEAASAIEIGLLPEPADVGILAWPWPGIAPEDFVGRDEGGWIGDPRRVMSAAEAAVHGLSDNGGVVQRVYLLGPDGATIYSFSLWPMQPDESG